MASPWQETDLNPESLIIKHSATLRGTEVGKRSESRSSYLRLRFFNLFIRGKTLRQLFDWLNNFCIQLLRRVFHYRDHLLFFRKETTLKRGLKLRVAQFNCKGKVTSISFVEGSKVFVPFLQKFWKNYNGERNNVPVISARLLPIVIALNQK